MISVSGSPAAKKDPRSAGRILFPVLCLMDKKHHEIPQRGQHKHDGSGNQIVHIDRPCPIDVRGPLIDDDARRKGRQDADRAPELSPDALLSENQTVAGRTGNIPDTADGIDRKRASTVRTDRFHIIPPFRSAVRRHGR